MSLNTLKKHLINIPGWRTGRKIIVIESDDWGSIRMASKEAFENLLAKGYPVNYCIYNKYDALEKNKDIENLMEVLGSVKDSHGNPAKFTINNVVANPDFEKIKTDNFEKYYYKPFTETLEKYPESGRVMDLYRQAIDEKLFQIQFHGREHVNINRWLTALQNGNSAFNDAFDEDMFTLARSKETNGKRDYLDAFGDSYEKEFNSESTIIEEGLDLFEKIWGFRASSFIAPCYVWPASIENKLWKKGIKYIQGTHVQRVPQTNLEDGIKKKYHYMGQINSHGQCYIIRNVFFEPATYSEEDVLQNTISQIKLAFQYRKPAVIQSHRVNYMGSIEKHNRSKNLKLLCKLLSKIVELYPSVEFMSTDQLGTLMDN